MAVRAKVPGSKGHGETMSAMTLVIEARSLDLPTGAHPNKMPFTGVLTRLDVASDKPPNGSGGKRIVVTRAAAEEALDSLLGMAVDLTKGLDGHDAQNKVGLITGAHIEGNALLIEGFIYAADFPTEALRIHLEQADLGFSFEARNLAVDSMETDPLVVNKLSFTGAAILMKSDAAYTMTSLAAAAAKLNIATATTSQGDTTMTEIADAVTAALKDVLGPLTTTLGELKVAQAAQGAVIDEIKNLPTGIHAVSAAVSKVEPHAANLENLADKFESAGIGCASGSGHVHHMRRMAASMRAAAHLGTIPSSYHDSGSYYAAADPRQQHQQQQDPPAKVAVEDTAEYKTLKAAHDAALQASKDAAASVETKIADLKATLTGMRPSPERKTLSPEIVSLMARIGLTAPEEGSGGGRIELAKVDSALATVADIGERMRIKTALTKQGLI